MEVPDSGDIAFGVQPVYFLLSGTWQMVTYAAAVPCGKGTGQTPVRAAVIGHSNSTAGRTLPLYAANPGLILGISSFPEPTRSHP